MSKQNASTNGSAATAGENAPHGSGAKASSHHRPLKGFLTRKIREAQARKVLLFLSTGNTCRSPMAAAYLKKLLEERKTKNIEIRSAGVMTIAGLLATDESKLMLEPYGVTLDKHRSQPLTEEILRRADLVLGMTPFHVQMALRLSPSSRGKTHLLKEYTQTDPKNRPIPDPMGCTLEVYKRCFRQIKLACDRLVDLEFITGKPSKRARPSGAVKLRPAAAAPKPRLRHTERSEADTAVEFATRNSKLKTQHAKKFAGSAKASRLAAK